jgi:hypothetical protein
MAFAGWTLKMKPRERGATGAFQFGGADAAGSADDDARLCEILEAVGSAPSHLGALLYDYYRDKGRADRTSRELLYLHLGIAAGVLRRTEAQQAGPDR